jgi:hypothetical protein
MRIVNKEKDNLKCPIKNYFPQIETLYEDCFILYDKDLNNYLIEYFSLDNYLYKTYKTADDFINNLKEVDCEMNRLSLIEIKAERIKESLKIYDNVINNQIIFDRQPANSDEIKTFPFAMYFNLYHFHRFEIMKKIYFEIFELRKKNREDEQVYTNMSLLIKKLNELTFLLKNITYKFYIYASHIRERLDINKIRYPSSMGHYLMEVGYEIQKEKSDFWSDIYLNIRDNINTLN